MISKLIEKYLKEATYTAGYGDESLAADDDYPTGNILMGDKYKSVPYYNRLTNFNINWIPDLKPWKWDKFDATHGMESLDVYHRTLTKTHPDQLDIRKDADLTDRLFKHMGSAPPKDIPRTARALGNDIFPDNDAWGKYRDYEQDPNPEDEGEMDAKHDDDIIKKLTKQIDFLIKRSFK